MKALFDNNRFIHTALFLMLAGALPQLSLAQRFNHAGGGDNRGGGAPSRPAFNPAPRQAAPSRPQEVRPAPVQRPVEPDYRTINGGSRNIGNHDFNRNANDRNANDRNVNLNVHENVTVHSNVEV